MNSSKKEANLEELREPNDTGLFVLLFFNFQHWLSQPAYYIAAWDQEHGSRLPSVSQTKETALHWASTVGLWNDIFGYICTLCRQVAPVYFLEAPSIKMQKHSLHNCLLES